MPADQSRYHVLFLCQHNSARSIFGEAIVNAMPESGLRAYSAGSDPAEEIHPETELLLASLSIPTADLYPKHWDVFAAGDAPPMDFVFTVCDKAAFQTCPGWPGRPVTAHWGIEDPSRITGDGPQRHQAFRAAFHAMRARVHLFASLPIASLDRLRLQHEVSAIGRIPGDYPPESN